VTKRNIANIVASFRNGVVSLTITRQTAWCLLHAIGVEEREQQEVEEPQERDPNLYRFVERVAEVVSDGEKKEQ
jgi:hypothetical protein